MTDRRSFVLGGIACGAMSGLRPLLAAEDACPRLVRPKPPPGKIVVMQCWDDSPATDIRLMALCRKYGAKATFNLIPRTKPSTHHVVKLDPKDPAKWARICEHIIAHYTEGWANGFKWKMEHWEIWNEPNHNTKNDNGAKGSFWCGPRDEFKRLWKTAQLHLKARFPHLKIGGAGFAGPEREWGGEILHGARLPDNDLALVISVHSNHNL